MKPKLLATVVAALGFSIMFGCAKSGTGGAATQPAAASAAKAVSVLVVPSASAPIPYGDSRFVMKWMVLGPFTFADNDFGGDQQQSSIQKAFIANEADLDGTQAAPVGTKWQEKNFAGGTELGRIDLQTLYPDADHVCAYAVANIESPADLPNIKLLTGSDDYIKVWINGKLVHTYATERRAGEADQDVTTVSLKKGINRIVVKCVDVVLDWNFYLRFATADGKSIAVKTQ